jgi:hypothetical protein
MIKINQYIFSNILLDLLNLINIYFKPMQKKDGLVKPSLKCFQHNLSPTQNNISFKQ